MSSVSVIIPAYNAERALGLVLAALAEQEPRPGEVIVVDDGSTDRTRAIAEEFRVRVVARSSPGFAGGARNAGWDAARGDIVAFLDADLVPMPGWTAGVFRAMNEFPDAVVMCGWTAAPRTPWEWVGHLQYETPFLPEGDPRPVPSVSSGCMVLPRDVPIRWDESFGAEDGIFSADALAAGLRLIFDPRFSCVHVSGRETFSDLRRSHDRYAYGFARCAGIRLEKPHKRLFARVPVHYFALVRLALIYRRLRSYRGLRARFVRLLPRLIVAEWALGLSAVKYAVRRPPLRGEDGAWFR